MITIDAFLVLLAAVSLPATYIFLVSRWIEPDYRKTYPTATKEPVMATGDLVHKPA